MRGFALFAVLALGCSSSSNESSNNTADTGASDSASDTPSVGSEVVTCLNDYLEPLDAAHVQVLAEDGAVLSEGVSGADGKLTLPNFKFSEKPVTTVAWKDNKHSLEILHGFTRAAIDKLDTSLGLPPGTVQIMIVRQGVANPKLSGNIVGGTDGSFYVVAGNTITTAFASSASYSVRMRPGVAGKALVTEMSSFGVGTTLDQTYRQFVLFDLAAATADTKLDLDLSKGMKLTSQRTKGRAEITGGKDGPLGGDSRAFAFVSAGDPGIFTGGITKAAPSADGSAFEYELEWVDSGIKATNPLHVFRIIRADDSFSQRAVIGNPTEGEVMKNFPLPLAITFTKMTLADEFSFEGSPAGAFRLVLGFKAANDLALRISVPETYASNSFKLPKLPDEALAVLPTAALQARLAVGVDVGAKGILGGFSQTRPFSLTR